MCSAPAALTKGEEMFEAACRFAGIAYRRVPVARSESHRRPDYKVTVGHCGALVEVKQIDPNEQDRQEARDLAAGKIAVRSNKPGARLRSAIRDASGQLRRASLRRIPTAVAIFDTMFSFSYTDPYNVKVAMYGLDAMILALPEDRSIAPHTIGWKSAGSATLTEEHNTSVSAVIIIRALPPSERKGPILIVYHNHFARVPFYPNHLRGSIHSQYALGQSDNGFTTWIEV